MPPPLFEKDIARRSEILGMQWPSLWSIVAENAVAVVECRVLELYSQPKSPSFTWTEAMIGRRLALSSSQRLLAMANTPHSMAWIG